MKLLCENERMATFGEFSKISYQEGIYSMKLTCIRAYNESAEKKYKNERKKILYRV